MHLTGAELRTVEALMCFLGITKAARLLRFGTRTIDRALCGSYQRDGEKNWGFSDDPRDATVERIRRRLADDDLRSVLREPGYVDARARVERKLCARAVDRGAS